MKGKEQGRDVMSVQERDAFLRIVNEAIVEESVLRPKFPSFGSGSGAGSSPGGGKSKDLDSEREVVGVRKLSREGLGQRIDVGGGQQGALKGQVQGQGQVVAQPPNQKKRFGLKDVGSVQPQAQPQAVAAQPQAQNHSHPRSPSFSLSSQRINLPRRVGGQLVDPETEEAFDRLKEECARFATDVDILDWARRVVFKPNVVEEKVEQSDGTTTTISNNAGFPSTYPLILTHLLALFRDRFQNPHLTLALFSFARSYSNESYLSGCSTSAYNEVLRTRWESFRDLKGVEEGVREMMKHGVGWDKITSSIVSGIVEELSAKAFKESGEKESKLEFGENVLERLMLLDSDVEKYVELGERQHSAAMIRQAEGRRARLAEEEEEEDHF